MSPLVTALHYLRPWQFHLSLFLACAIVVWMCARGLAVLHRKGTRVGFGRAFTFLLGVALSYAALQTYLDFTRRHEPLRPDRPAATRGLIQESA